MGDQMPDNTDLQGVEPQDVPGDVTPDVEPDAPAGGGDGDGGATDDGKGWSKESQQVYTQTTQKIADLKKEFGDKLDKVLDAVQSQAA